MYTMLTDNNAKAAKMSLVSITLHLKIPYYLSNIHSIKLYI